MIRNLFDHGKRLALALSCVVCLCVSIKVSAADLPFITAVDVSMLPTIEKCGGVFSDGGKRGDAIQILADHGCNLFRVRLFVNPDPDYVKNFGAVQSLDYVRGLAKRIKATGALFLLDIHYSDSWADPGRQVTPEGWRISRRMGRCRIWCRWGMRSRREFCGRKVRCWMCRRGRRGNNGNDLRG